MNTREELIFYLAALYERERTLRVKSSPKAMKIIPLTPPVIFKNTLLIR
jgi:hypothetical protein